MKIFEIFRRVFFPKKSITLTVPILRAGTVNNNGHTYTQDTINAIAKKINAQTTPLFGIMGLNPNLLPINLGEVTHAVRNARINGDLLKVDISILETPYGKELENLIKANPKSVVFRPCGTGTVSPAGVIHDYTLISVNAIPRNRDAWNKIL